MATLRRRLQESTERANPVTPVHFWQSPPGAGTDIYLITHLDVYSVIHEHALDALPNETGGFLLGHVRCDSSRATWHIEIDEMIPVEPLSQNPAHFSFGWRDVDRVRSHRQTSHKALIGWYHTHPDMGIFLSETDLEKTHRVLFAEPFQLALVYDPVRCRAGYFFWEGPQFIDASSAPWREFEIAVPDDDTTRPMRTGVDDTVTGRAIPVVDPAAPAAATAAPAAVAGDIAALPDPFHDAATVLDPPDDPKPAGAPAAEPAPPAAAAPAGPDA